MSRFRWFINPVTGAVNRLRSPAGELLVPPPGSFRPFGPHVPVGAIPAEPIRRSIPLPMPEPRQINLSFDSPSFPPDSFVRGQASRLEDFVRLRATGEPAGIVDAPFPGIRRARPTADPQDVQFIHPRLDVPEPFPPTGFNEENLFRWQSGRLEPRDIQLGVVGGGDIRYVPLTAEEVIDIKKAIKDDPFGSYIAVRQNYELAETPQDFGRVLEQSRLLRENLDMEPELLAGLNSAMARASRRFGVPETQYDEIVSPILYRNSPDIPAKVRANPTLDEVRAAYSDSDKLRMEINKSIRATKKPRDLEQFDTFNNGGIINRALVKGEISQSDAVYLMNQLNYARINLLKKNGILGPSIKNDVRAKGGQRGVDIIPNMSELSEGRKVEIYKAALHTAETPDEVAQVYMMARSDIRSPAFLDEIDEIAGMRGNFLARVEGVEAPTFVRRGTSTIDEESIRTADRALMDDEARRAINDPTRPAFPSDDVTPEDTIMRRLFRDDEGAVVEEVTGGGRSRLINKSLETPPPNPNVPLGSGRMTGFTEEFAGPGAYVPRTIANAQEADITIAIATDFSTFGERLTAGAAQGRVRAVKGAKKWESDWGRPGQHGRVTELEQIDHMSANIDQHVESIVNKLNIISAQQGRPVVINGAGNGLGSIKTQAEADSFARHLIERITTHPQRGFDIDYVVTGGQNGYDIAIAKAAKAYGIPVKINPPYTSKGSIMLQEPGNAKGIIFMEPQEYVRYYRLDTGDVGILGS